MNKKYTYLIIIFLTIACLAAFGRIAGNEFINFDDNIYITENNHIRSGLNAESIKWAFSSFVSKNWHPLTWLSLMLDYSLFGTHSGGYHLMSLLLHIGSVIFLFLFLNKTTQSPWRSAFAAALFALHPLRVESVAWAAERKDVLSMFFGMASLYAYAFYAESLKLSRYLICLILFALSLLSKSMLVTLPFIFLLLDYWPLGRWQEALKTIKGKAILPGRLLMEKIPFLVLTLASGIITVWAQYEADYPHLSFPSRLANAVISYVAYLKKFLLPIDLAVFYPFQSSFPLWQILGSGLILLGVTVLVIYFKGRRPFLFVGWFWYLGALVPVSGLIQVNAPMADRYTYLPSIGIAIMLVWGMPLILPGDEIRKKILIPAAMMILLVLSALTYKQCGYWKDSITLFSHALRVTKKNILAQINLASALHKNGKSDEAIDSYNTAIRLNPNYAESYYGRGNVYADSGQHQKAMEDLNNAIRLKHDYADAYNNRGTVYHELGRYQEAIEDYNKAIRLKPGYIIYYNRGNSYIKTGRIPEAIEDFNQTIRLKRDFIEAYNNRGFAYFNQGNNKDGCHDAQKACALGNCQLLEATKNKKICSETR